MIGFIISTNKTDADYHDMFCVAFEVAEIFILHFDYFDKKKIGFYVILILF